MAGILSRTPGVCAAAHGWQHRPPPKGHSLRSMAKEILDGESSRAPSGGGGHPSGRSRHGQSTGTVSTARRSWTGSVSAAPFTGWQSRKCPAMSVRPSLGRELCRWVDGRGRHWIHCGTDLPGLNGSGGLTNLTGGGVLNSDRPRYRLKHGGSLKAPRSSVGRAVAWKTMRRGFDSRRGHWKVWGLMNACQPLK